MTSGFAIKLVIDTERFPITFLMFSHYYTYSPNIALTSRYARFPLRRGRRLFFFSPAFDTERFPREFLE